MNVRCDQILLFQSQVCLCQNNGEHLPPVEFYEYFCSHFRWLGIAKDLPGVRNKVLQQICRRELRSFFNK
jgi:hypothetical protein